MCIYRFFNKFNRYAPDTLFGILNSMGATALVDLSWERLVRAIINCHPQKKSDDCNQRIALQVTYASIFCWYLDYLIRWIPITRLRYNSTLNTIQYSWNIFLDIISMWDFYLFIWLALDSEIRGKDKEGRDKEMPDWPDFTMAILTTFILGVVSNSKVRRPLNNYCSKLTITSINCIFEVFRGFSSWRAFVAGIETVIDIFTHKNFYFSLMGNLTRYIVGGVGAFFKGLVVCLNGLNAHPEIFFHTEEYPRLTRVSLMTDGLIRAIIFGIITFTELSGIHNSIHKISLSVGFSLMLPLSLLKSCVKNRVVNLPQNQQIIHEPIPEPSPSPPIFDGEEPLLDESQNFSELDTPRL